MPATSKTESPICGPGVAGATGRAGTPPRFNRISARSVAGSKLYTVTVIAGPFPWRSMTGGPGLTVAALTVLYDVSSRVSEELEAMAKAVPTEAWAFWSVVETKNNDGASLLSRFVKELPPTGADLSGPRALLMIALSWAVS